jgi:hypothetical protein
LKIIKLHSKHRVKTVQLEEMYFKVINAEFTAVAKGLTLSGRLIMFANLR